MKKIFLGLALVLGTLVFSQDYYDTYPTQYNGYEYYDNSYDYPDDYYYNYPTDYYPDQYYQGYYNDYQKAVYSVNWDQFFRQYRLSPFQVNQIMMLNSRFASYDAWNSYYRYNPDRWYYDRFYALQNILGPSVFVVYQNVYFQGRSPFVYYRNRCVIFYARQYPVRPIYRNVNVNIYKVNRGNFAEGFRGVNRNNNMISPSNGNNGTRDLPVRSGAIGNAWGGSRDSQSNGVRNQSANIIRDNDNSGMRNQSSPRGEMGNIRSQNSGGIRNQNNGMRQSQSIERKSDNNGQRSSAPRLESATRSSAGARLISR